MLFTMPVAAAGPATARSLRDELTDTMPAFGSDAADVASAPLRDPEPRPPRIASRVPSAAGGMRRSPLHRRTALRRGGVPLRRRTPLERAPVPPASPAQRDRVHGAPCIVCGARTRVDPAHLVPRAVGGCDDALCVVPLCRIHHRAYDRGALDLVPHLEPDHRAEAAHAVGHLGLAGALRRLSGRRDAGAA
jgi:hypothetical protein